MAQLLSESEIQEKARELPEWRVEGKALKCQKKFKDFVEAIAFVNQLVEPAEKSQHHPDLTISYNTVTIGLTTHDAGGLTEKDFEMAQIVSQIEA